METELLMRWVNRLFSAPSFVFFVILNHIVIEFFKLGPQLFWNYLKAVSAGEQSIVIVNEVFVVYLAATVATMAGMWLTTTENSPDPVSLGFIASIVNHVTAILFAVAFRFFILGW